MRGDDLMGAEVIRLIIYLSMVDISVIAALVMFVMRSTKFWWGLVAVVVILVMAFVVELIDTARERSKSKQRFIAKLSQITDLEEIEDLKWGLINMTPDWTYPFTSVMIVIMYSLFWPIFLGAMLIDEVEKRFFGCVKQNW